MNTVNHTLSNSKLQVTSSQPWKSVVLILLIERLEELFSTVCPVAGVENCNPWNFCLQVQVRNYLNNDEGLDISPNNEIEFQGWA